MQFQKLKTQTRKFTNLLTLMLLTTVQIKHILTVIIRILTVSSPLQPGRLQLLHSEEDF